MDASIFPAKTAVTYAEVDRNYPYTIRAEDEGGSEIVIYFNHDNFTKLLGEMISAETEKIHCELASTIARAKEDERGHRD